LDKVELSKSLDKVAYVANASKVFRFMRQPVKYVLATLYRLMIFPINKRELRVKCHTFYNDEMMIGLPSSTDIYLTKGKSHDSEIRLARFMINYLDSGDYFIDVGAHYGYFSGLGSLLVGKQGRVTAIEAAPRTFEILKVNLSKKTNCEFLHGAVSDESGSLTFYEFPNLYSEYNTIDNSQFENSDWYKKYKPRAVSIESLVLGDYLKKQKRCPKIIKIDVEGAEFKVVNGAKDYLIEKSPFVVLEYLASSRNNEIHRAAAALLVDLGYMPHAINENGTIRTLEEIESLFVDEKTDSDNIVFCK